MSESGLEPALLYPSDTDIDAVLDEFKGDPREAIRALLEDLAALAEDRNDKVSHGYVRGMRVHFSGRRA